MRNRSLYLVRHGHRLDEVNKKWYEKDGLNKYDPPLSDEGKDQAQKLAQRLQQEPIDMIFTSPYWRALQTAHPIAECLELPLYVENGIGEWLGKVMIPHEPNITPAFQRRDEFPMLEFSHNPRVIPHYPETAQQCFERLENTITQLLSSYEGNLLIVGHGRTVTGLAHRLVGKPESSFKLNNAGITKLDYDNDRWICRLNSDDSHLTCEVIPQFI